MKKLNLSLKRKFLFSFLLILIIPVLLLGCFGYWWMKEILQEETEKNYMHTLEKTKEEIDNTFREFNDLAYTLSESQWVQKIAYINGDKIDMKRVDFQQLADYSNNLRNFQSLNSIIERISIVFNEKNQVISVNGLDDFDWYFTNGHHYEEYAVSDWHEILDQHRDGIILNPNRLTSYNFSDNILSYVKTIPTIVDQKPRATMLVGIKEDKINRLLKDTIQHQGASIFIIDSSGNIVTEVNLNIELLADNNFSDTNTSKVELLTISGNHYLVFTIPSEVVSWNYISVVPQAEVLENLNYFRNLSITIVVFVLVVGIFISLGLTKTNYNPIKKITEYVTENDTNNISLPKSFKKNTYQEINAIQNAFDNLLSSQKALEYQVNKYLPIATQSLFLNMFNNALSLEQIEEMKQFIGIDFNYEKWVVALVHSGNLDVSQIEDKSFRWFLHDSTSFCLLALGKNRYSIVINSDDNNVVSDIIHTALATISKGVPNYDLNELAVGISAPCLHFHELGSSYKEAVAALNYLLIQEKTNEKIIFFPDISEKSSLIYWFPPDKENELSNKTQTGDYKAVESIINELIIVNLKNVNFNHITMQCLFYELLSIAFKLAKEEEIKYIIYSDKISDEMMETIEEVKSYLFHVFYELCCYFVSKNANDSNEYIVGIVSFIDMCSFDPNFSLNNLAENFDMSITKMSRIIKEFTGESFINYLTRRRIEKAKELLVNNNLTIEEISRKVGYTNNLTFRRAFKKNEGINPSEYRDILIAKSKSKATPS